MRHQRQCIRATDFPPLYVGHTLTRHDADGEYDVDTLIHFRVIGYSPGGGDGWHEPRYAAEIETEFDGADLETADEVPLTELETVTLRQWFESRTGQDAAGEAADDALREIGE